MRRFALAVLCTLAVAAPALAAPVDDVKNAMLKLGHASSYHIAADANGRSVGMDFVKPDRMHVTMQQMEMIRIGTATYVKVNGNWMKFAMPNADAMVAPVTRAVGFSEHPEQMTTVTDGGSKMVDGEMLHLYTVQSSGNAGPATVYVGTDGFPHRVDNTDASGKVTTVHFSHFDDPAIAISAPI